MREDSSQLGCIQMTIVHLSTAIEVAKITTSGTASDKKIRLINQLRLRVTYTCHVLFAIE